MKCWHCFNEVNGSEEICPYCGRILAAEQDGSLSDKAKPAGSDKTKPGGSDKTKPAGSDKIKHTGNDSEESAGSDEKKPAGSDNKKSAGNDNEKPEGNDNEKPTVKKIILILSILAAALLVVFFLYKDEILKNDTAGLFHRHQWKNATCLNPKICTICSKTDGEALGHDWREATCTLPRRCIRCSKTDGEALGHKWTEATCTKPRTCSRCKRTDGEALGHEWTEATCTEPRTCSRCGVTDGAALGHDWQEATYDSPKTCRRCGETEGTVKGFIPGSDLDGSFSDERINIRDFEVSAFELNDELYKCRSIELGITVQDSTGDPLGRFAFWGRSNGEWVKLGTVYVEETGTAYSDSFDIDPAIDIDAIAVTPDASFDHDVSWTYVLHLYQAQVE